MLLRVFSWHFLALLTLLSGSAKAAETPVTKIVATARAWNPNKKFFDFRTESWVHGPTLRKLDGREHKPGANITIDHLAKAGYYLGNGWKLRLHQPFIQRLAHPTTEVRSWTLLDPVIGFGKAGILKEEVHGVEWRLIGSYSVPVSHFTKKGVGTDMDSGDGRFVLDSKLDFSRKIQPLWLNLRWFAYQNLKRHPKPAGLDRRYEIFNKVGINPLKKTDAYIGYNNYINWYRDGYKDPWKTNQALELGGTYYFTPDTFINPFVETPFHLKDTQLWLYIETRFI